MKLHTSLFVVCMFLLTPVMCAQSSQPPEPEEQNETMRDTLKRMQIKREEQEHKKILDKGQQLQGDVDRLSKDTIGEALPKSAEKRLREIEKWAKQIRSEFGGGGGDDDDPFKPAPGSLADSLKLLTERSEKLNKALEKTSRRVISLNVIETATEIVQLSRHLRVYMY
jgi:hypothetical protein